MPPRTPTTPRVRPNTRHLYPNAPVGLPERFPALMPQPGELPPAYLRRIRDAADSR